MMDIFKVDVIENAGENWMIADLGTDIDGKHYIITTNYVRASELSAYSDGPKGDAELIVRLLNEYYEHHRS